MEEQRRNHRASHVNRPAFGYPSVSARLEMQQRRNRGRNQVIGTKLKHDGSLGYISRGRAGRRGNHHDRAARRTRATLRRAFCVAAAVIVLVCALAWIGIATSAGSWNRAFEQPALAAMEKGYVAREVGVRASGAGSKALSVAALDHASADASKSAQDA